MTDHSPASPDQIKKWREDTPGCTYRNHLNNAGAALMPQPVIDTVQNHLELESRIGAYEAGDAASEDIQKAYTSVGELIGADSKNVAVVENATVATSQALSAFEFESGDTIITTNVDYSSNQIMLLNLSKRFGVDIMRAEDLPEGGVDPASVRRLIRKHRPKLMLMSWIPTNSGLVQDATSVGGICREENVPIILDACQAVGQIAVDVKELKCDFLAATSRKFLRGPRGMGFLYVSDRVLEKNMYPLFPDTHGARWTGPETFRLEEGAKRFENWEFPHALLLGMGMAAEYANQIGVEVIAQRATELGDYTRGKLTDIPGVRVLDYGNQKCAIVSATFEEIEADVLVQKLRERNINTSSAFRTSGVIDMNSKKANAVLRISPHYYNRRDEVDQVVDELRSFMM
ncbi:aminotransferase class V-fold PLP-dependent enzyme [Rhodohalobacter sp. 8-1]|uniref:aminotransferase class V-fold PLP-dependent enzyme n=1 Tax=Rhodohalobacter sp. 8-1 TaxID=3131972 RepID=UPI0030EC5F47